MEELRSGLWTWTAAHPDWEPGHGRSEGWEQQVRSYALDAGDSLVLFDPPWSRPRSTCSPAVDLSSRCEISSGRSPTSRSSCCSPRTATPVLDDARGTLERALSS